MNEILRKERLNETVTLMEVYNPRIAKKAKAGQFVILRVREQGERIPLTIADYDEKKGSVTIIFQPVGATTMLLDALEEGEKILDFTGPLGKPTETEGLKKVAVVGGGVGCAIAYPIAKALKEQGTVVHSIAGFRNESLVILEDEFKKVSDEYFLMTDDGSKGKKGFVTTALKELVDGGEQYDEVIAIGPLVMMKFVYKTVEHYGIKTVVSMNPLMIDGTGMCGCCRLTVGGEVKFACVDGPDFDASLVDFDETIKRAALFKPFEARKREEACNLLKEKKNG